MITSGRCLAIARLAAQQVEVLRRRREVRDADVALGGELQEALEARARSARGPSPRSRAAAAASGASSGPTWPAPETMNWSMMTCARVDEVAELRLPQHERLGRLHRVAVLEAEAGDLASAASCAAPSAPARPAAYWIGETRWPVLASCRTRWRWENVPRSASWPVRRIGVPSVSSEAKASASACAQSMPPSAPSASRRRSSCLTSLGWTVKPSGTRSSSSLSARRRSADDRGLDLGRGRAVELVVARRLLVAGAPPARSLSSRWRSARSSQISWRERVGLLLRDRRPASTSCAA